MSVAVAVRLAPFTVLALFAACWEAPTSDSQPAETGQDAVVHPEAASSCIASYQQCTRACESSPANCDRSPTSGLCIPNLSRIYDCKANCARKAGCMPWEIGVLTGLPCRWSDEPYECNFFLCSRAATACIMDCFDIHVFDDPALQTACNDACYDHYGCRPRPSDPCTPLPDGYIHCACPDEHGVECHPDDDRSCSQ